MKKMRTVIVDDETDSLKLMAHHLSQFEQIDLVGMFNESITALQQIPVLKPDLVFMDIEMPFKNGFQLLEDLPEKNFNVVFVTAYNEFAIKALRINALDYLVKPLQVNELAQAIEKAEKMNGVNTRQVTHVKEQLLNNRVDKIAIPLQGGLYFLPVEEIIYAEANSNYTHVFTSKNEKIVLSKTLKELEEALDNTQFSRIHRQFIINLKFLKFLNRNEGIVELSNGAKIPISRRQRDDLLERFRGL